ncbi:efflux RND transporter periplasmic adaptor subunit [Candidatus Sumerlaeota bacterium]|nr:efflux RND transporter periplasmic adaptor subunit [Candidatus Sumerlaeota bacterium]
MKNIVRIFAVLLSAGVLLLGGFRTYEAVQAKKDKALAKNEIASTLRVQVHTIKKGTVNLTVPVTAQVHAMNEVDIISKVTGRLERLRLPDDTLLDEGVSVGKGQQIAIIDRAALKAAVNHTLAAIEVAKASLLRAEVGEEDAQREMKRWEALFAKGAASEDSRDKAITAYKRAVADVALCKSQIAQAESALEQAKVNLAEATIIAPISGVVSIKYVDEGSMVGPGIPLVRIVRIDTVKVIGSVSERYVASIVPSLTPVRLLSDALPGEEIKGKIFQIGVEADSVTRTVNLETRIPNPEAKLKPGMFVRMMVDIETHENVMIIPDAALVIRDGKPMAYAVRDSHVNILPLQLGLSEGDVHEALEGVQPGDKVVMRGQQLLKEGQQVEIAGEDSQ